MLYFCEEKWVGNQLVTVFIIRTEFDVIFELMNCNWLIHLVGISTNQISIEEIINSRDDYERQ